VVISEIMYNPVTADEDKEFVELHNITDQTVALYDSKLVPWKFTRGLGYTLPSSLTIPPKGFVVVVKNPAAFFAAYGEMPAGVRVVGPYTAALSNGGEKLELSKPGEVVDLVRQYIRVDRVTYDDANGWPTSADGEGDSLTRRVMENYGNDPANWKAAPPTPGR